MARRGRFGRLPAAAPDLTSTIVSIAKEMQAAQDTNIMNAWQKGGLFEGKQATDAIVLKYWQTRLAGVDKTDPKYDEYKQNIDQLDYSIAESKQTVLYKQGKLTDTGLANFYLGWAKKVNVNTEFYRVLQRDAAQFLQAAKTRSTAGSTAAAQKAYVDGQNALLARTGGGADAVTQVITNLAFANGLIGQGQGLGNFDPTDPGALAGILGRINGGQRTGGPDTGKTAGESDATVLYWADSQGNLGSAIKGNHPVTLGSLRTEIRKTLPGWSGQVSINDLIQLNTQKEAGMQTAMAIAFKKGDATLHGKLATGIANLTESNRQMGIFSTDQAWSSLNKVYMTQSGLGDPNGPQPTAAQLIAVTAAYRNGLGGLLKTPGLDANTLSRIQAEIDGNPNISNLGEDMMGLGPENPKSSGTVGSNAQGQAVVTLAQQQIDEVATGLYTWTYGTLNGTTGVFTPSMAGKEIGAVLTSGAGMAGAIPVMVDQGPGQPQLPLHVTTEPVTIGATDVHGLPISTGGSADAVVGTTTIIAGVRYFAITPVGSATPVWTPVPLTGGTVHDDGTSYKITVSLSNVDTLNNTTPPGYDPKTGLTVTAPSTPNGKAGFSFAANQGDGMLLLDSVDTVLKAGVNAQTQNPSLTVATHLGEPAVLQKLAGDPVWAAAVSAEVGALPGATQAVVSQFQANLVSGTGTATQPFNGPGATVTPITPPAPPNNPNYGRFGNAPGLAYTPTPPPAPTQPGVSGPVDFTTTTGYGPSSLIGSPFAALGAAKGVDGKFTPAGAAPTLGLGTHIKTAGQIIIPSTTPVQHGGESTVKPNAAPASASYSGGVTYVSPGGGGTAFGKTQTGEAGMAGEMGSHP